MSSEFQKYPNVCLFCGHRDAPLSLYEQIYHAAEKLVQEDGITEFWSGSYGNFDHMGERAVRELKKRYPYVRLTLVLAYHPGNRSRQSDAPAFDGSYLPDMGRTPAGVAIVKRNEIIAKQAGFVIAYIIRSFGGAAKTLAAARKGSARIVLLE